MMSDQTTFRDASFLTAPVESSVPQGGDAGDRTRTRLTLTGAGRFAFGNAGAVTSGQAVGVEVLGDAGAEILPTP